MEGMMWKRQYNLGDKPTMLKRDTSEVAERPVFLLKATQN